MVSENGAAEPSMNGTYHIGSSKATFAFADGSPTVKIDLIEADEEILKLLRVFRSKTEGQDYYEDVVRPFAKWIAESNGGELLGLGNAHGVLTEVQRVVAKKAREHVDAIGSSGKPT